MKLLPLFGLFKLYYSSKKLLTPTNILLTNLAVSDLLTLLTVIIAGNINIIMIAPKTLLTFLSMNNSFRYQFSYSTASFKDRLVDKVWWVKMHHET